MGTRVVGGDDLGAARFAVSPVWEAVTSLRLLQRPDGPGGLLAWARETRAEIGRRSLDLTRLQALVPAEGHLADLLTPTPSTRFGDLEHELAAIGRADAHAVRRDVDLLRDQGAPPEAVPVLDAALAAPTELVERVVGDLRAYVDAVITPVWPRLRAIAEADVAARAERMANLGSHAVLGDLHARVRVEGGRLLVASTCGLGPVPTGRGLVLVPCTFARPDLLVRSVPGEATTLAYAPRGVAALWAPGHEEPEALGRLLGRSRAAALAELDLPLSTRELADRLDLGAPTTNAHLKALLGGGLVRAERRGRSVLYRRTGLGDDLLRASG